MKKMRRLIPAIAMLLVSAVMLSTASFAWFTMSSEAKAEGMSVTATASSSLLISDRNFYEGFKNAGGTINLASKNKSLEPATHYVEPSDDNPGTPLAADQNLAKNDLVTVANSSTVVSATGAYTGEYVVATAANYIDYVMYIGSAGAAMTEELNAYFSLSSAIAYSIHNAISIDVLVDTTTKGENGAGETAADLEYKRTVSLYDISTSQNTLGTGDSTYKVVKVNIADTIPSALVATDEGTDDFGDSIKVVLRVYFDGNLPDATTTATGDYFVRNSTATLEGAGFKVEFKAEDASSGT